MSVDHLALFSLDTWENALYAEDSNLEEHGFRPSQNLRYSGDSAYT